MRKKITWFIAAILVVLVGSSACGRLRPPGKAQAAALALLRQDHAPTPGHNAWVVFWLLDYDVPADQLDAVYALERQHLFDWADRLPPDASSVPTYDPLVAETYPKRPEISGDDRALLCRGTDTDCLAKVRERARALRILLAAQAPRLARLRGITPDDVLWDDTPIHPYTPLPAFDATGDLLLTAAALDFVEGRQQQALAQVCGDVRVMRQLHAHTNSLVGAMLTVAWSDMATRLFAGMLVGLPSDQAVPADCALAFAPITAADVDLCAPLQREYQLTLAGVAMADPSRSGRLQRLGMYMLYDPSGTRRLIAPHYAWACQPDARVAMLADHQVSDAQVPAGAYDLFDVVANPFGVILAEVVPSHVTYLNRNLDYAASLRLARQLLQARRAGLAAAALGRQLEQDFPVPSGAAPRAFRIDPDGRHLRMSYYAPRRGRDALVLPMAP